MELPTRGKMESPIPDCKLYHPGGKGNVNAACTLWKVVSVARDYSDIYNLKNMVRSHHSKWINIAVLHYIRK